jgi:ElaB/YqjD/DUF883 family membrane-anchored ribosome-binding protein
MIEYMTLGFILGGVLGTIFGDRRNITRSNQIQTATKGLVNSMEEKFDILVRNVFNELNDNAKIRSEIMADLHKFKEALEKAKTETTKQTTSISIYKEEPVEDIELDDKPKGTKSIVEGFMKKADQIASKEKSAGKPHAPKR